MGEEGTFSSGGTNRQFSIFVPPDRTDDALPLVVAMHGSRSTRQQQEEGSRMGSLGQREGFITVLPQALPRGTGTHPFWDLAPGGGDVPFIEDLVAHTENELCVDSRRVYLTGFSTGAMMSMVLACQHPDRYAAIAPVAGVINIEACDPSPPVPLIAFHGTGDQQVRFDGGVDPNVGNVAAGSAGPPRADIVDSWAARNNCADEPDRTRVGTDVERVDYACSPNGDVVFYVVEGGGHTWPGSTPGRYSKATAGTTTQTIDATELMWEFFQRHAVDQ